MADFVALLVTAVAIIAVAVVYFIKSRQSKTNKKPEEPPQPVQPEPKKSKDKEKPRKPQQQRVSVQPMKTAERHLNLGNTGPLCLSFEQSGEFLIVPCKNRQQALFSVSALSNDTSGCLQRYKLVEDSVVDCHLFKSAKGELEVALALDRDRAVRSYVIDPKSSKSRPGSINIDNAAKMMVEKVRVAPDASWVATLGDDTYVRVFHPNGTGLFGKDTGQMKNTELSVSSNSEFVGASAFTKAIVCYGIQRDRAEVPSKVVKAFTLSGHTNSIESLDFDRTSMIVATGGKDKKYNVWMSPMRWNEGDDIPKLQWTGTLDEAISMVRIAPGGATLAAMTVNGGLFFCRKSGIVKKVDVAHNQGVSHMEWTPDGKWVVVASAASQFLYAYANP